MLSLFQKKVNILVFSMITYADFHHGIANRNAFIVHNLAKHPAVGKILWVDFLHSRKKRWIKDYYEGIAWPKYPGDDLWKTTLSRVRKLENPENLFVYSTLLHAFSVIQMEAEVSYLLSKLSMNENLMIWSYNPLYAGYFDRFGQRCNVFDTVDNWMAHSSHAEHQELLKKNYQMIAERSEIVFTVSPALEDFYRSLGREKNVFCIGNGIEASLVTESTLSQTLQKKIHAIPRPRVGYLGSITPDRVDVDLLAFLARAHPSLSFVLAGPVWKGIRKKIQVQLSSLRNVHLLGRIPYQESYAMIREFDVCLIPHQHNAFISSTDPMKLYEYLALGKPVISMSHALPDDVKAFVYDVSSPEVFRDTIPQALSENDPALRAQRQAWAMQHTYSARVEAMMEIVWKRVFASQG